MGVPGLLTHLGPLLRSTNIFTAAAGKTIGVDGHVWLHSMAYHWAGDIVNDGNYLPLAKEFCQRAQYVRGQGVELLFVFDGAPTPAKRTTDAARQRKRAEAYAKVMHGNSAVLSAGAIKAAIKLGWPAVKAVVAELRKLGLPYIIAPYEADAQLALLANSGAVWAVATVDADFIIHGIRRIFYRITWQSGRASFWEQEVAEAWETWPDEDSWKTRFLTLLAECGVGALTAYTLAAGCDYDTKVEKVGTGRALTAVSQLRRLHGVTVFQPVLASDTLRLLAVQLQVFHEGPPPLRHSLHPSFHSPSALFFLSARRSICPVCVFPCL